MIGLLQRIDRALDTATIRTAMALMVLMCLVSMYQVLTRFVLGQPADWSETTSRALNIWMVYLGVAVCTRHGALVCVEFLHARLKGAAKMVLTLLVAAISLAVFAVMLVSGVEMTLNTRFQMLAGIENPFTGEGITIALVYAAIPAGAALSILAVLARLLEPFYAPASPRSEVVETMEILEV